MWDDNPWVWVVHFNVIGKEAPHAKKAPHVHAGLPNRREEKSRAAVDEQPPSMKSGNWPKC